MSTYSKSSPSGVNMVRDAMRGQQSEMSIPDYPFGGNPRPAKSFQKCEEKHGRREFPREEMYQCEEADGVAIHIGRERVYVKEGDFECVQTVNRYGGGGCTSGSRTEGGLCKKHQFMYNDIHFAARGAAVGKDVRLHNALHGAGYMTRKEADEERKRDKEEIARLLKKCGEVAQRNDAPIFVTSDGMTREAIAKMFDDEGRKTAEQRKEELAALRMEILAEQERSMREESRQRIITEALAKKQVEDAERQRRDVAALAAKTAAEQKKAAAELVRQNQRVTNLKVEAEEKYTALRKDVDKQKSTIDALGITQELMDDVKKEILAKNAARAAARAQRSIEYDLTAHI
jgi:hypothetical protein